MTTETDDDRPKLTDVLVPMGMGAALLALVLLAAAGTGYRLGIWSFMGGFRVFGLAAWLGLGAAAVSLWAAYLVRGMQPRSRLYKALFGAALGVAVAVIPWQWQQTVAKLPHIHDITTDTANPPVFVTLLAARADAPNSTDYGGSKIAAQQKEAYPDIKPVVLVLPADEAFARAEAAVRKLGWDVAALIAAEGRIEATDTTTWFAFKDDVVIRVRPVDGQPGSTRIDARSVSRVGMSDVGANAERLRAFIALVSN